MGYVGIALDYRNGTGKYPNLENNYQSNMMGMCLQMQTYLLEKLINQKKKRWIWSDFLYGKVGIAKYHGNHVDIMSQALFYYQFNWGFYGKWQQNHQQDWAIEWSLLNFAIDKISPNISGSSIMLSHRYQRWVIKIGTTARRDRIAGWIKIADKNFQIPMLYHVGMGYKFKQSHMLQIQVDWSAANRLNYTENNMKPISQLYINAGYAIGF
jgi:hypothetical protein